MRSELTALRLSHSYQSRGLRHTGSHRALHEVSLGIAAGDSIGLVGSSGSGKSTLLRALLALDKPQAGTVTFNGRPIIPGPVPSLRWYRRLVQYVPQNPAGSLDPRMTVRQLLMEPLRQLRIEGDHRTMLGRAMDRVDLPAALLERRPAELSGGQNQRVAIARALVPGPAILLADEPVSGLDLPLRNAVLTLLQQLVERDGMGLLFVSHDLSAVARLCRHTMVLAAGSIVEEGPTADLLHSPAHPATRELIAAVPCLSRSTEAP